MKKIFNLWKESWRAGFYFILFSIVFNFLSLPMLLGKTDMIKGNKFFLISFYILMFLFYFPFAVRWASKASGFRPPTKQEEAEEDRERVKKINKELQESNYSNKILQVIARTAQNLKIDVRINDMNKEEAVALLTEEMASFRKKPYSDLLPLIADAATREITGSSGTKYQIEVNGMWDDKKKRHLRVCGSIDDGRLRAWLNTKPYLDDFIIRPDGTFVGE